MKFASFAVAVASSLLPSKVSSQPQAVARLDSGRDRFLEDSLSLALIGNWAKSGGSKGHKSKSGKGNKGGKGHGLLSELLGKYCAEYDLLVASSEEMIQSSFCAVVEATSNPNLFMYRQCWKRAPTFEWLNEKGGMVAVDKGNTVEVHVAEARSLYDNVDDVVETGYLSGYFDGTKLELYVVQAGLGLVSLIPAYKTDADLDADGCPV